MAMNYSDKVMEHFTNPQNVGEIENASGCGTVGNAVCGDIMRVYLDIDENNVIQDAKFQDLRLRRRHRHELYGDRAREGQDGAGGP